MVLIAHLGPSGTYAEAAALAYAHWLSPAAPAPLALKACSSIPKTLQALAAREVDLAIVPVENSIEGGVTVTLDTLWQLEQLKLQDALVLPIEHALITTGTNLTAIRTIYSHPQALAQCQQWLELNVPEAKLVPTHSTTEALTYLPDRPDCAAIASTRAAQIYQLPVVACPINDRADNCTKFWVLGQAFSRHEAQNTALAFTLRQNLPGALMQALQLFADQQINLSRIESRPTKRSLGEYLFFIDLEAGLHDPRVQATLPTLQDYTETLKIFGSYDVLPPDVVMAHLQTALNATVPAIAQSQEI